MRRLLFFILMVAAVGASSYVVLLLVDFDNGGAPGRGWEIIEGLFNKLMAGEAAFGFTTTDFVVYGLLGFAVVNVAILFTMVIMFLMNFGMLNRIFKFYSVAGWFLVSALLFTIPYGLYYFNTELRPDHINAEGFPIMMAVPMIAAVVMFLLAFINKKKEKKA